MSRKRLSATPMSKQPIGIFDSGVGGLTIVRELRKTLPYEDLIYYGDMARLPYGTKSKEQIVRFSEENALFLKKKNVKAVVVACNSSSSAAFSSLLHKFSNIPFFDVIYPVAKEALRQTKNERVGVIATQATIESKAYEKALKSLDSKVKVFQKACPLFVSFVEEGVCSGKLITPVIATYLKSLKQKKIDTLILGCTHYPLLKTAIKKFMGKSVKVLDSTRPTAKIVEEGLGLYDLEKLGRKKGSLKIFVTDKPRNFIKVAEKFGGEKIAKVELVR